MGNEKTTFVGAVDTNGVPVLKITQGNNNVILVGAMIPETIEALADFLGKLPPEVVLKAMSSELDRLGVTSKDISELQALVEGNGIEVALEKCTSMAHDIIARREGDKLLDELQKEGEEGGSDDKP